MSEMKRSQRWCLHICGYVTETGFEVIIASNYDYLEINEN